MDPVEVNELFDKIVEISMSARLAHGEIPMSFLFVMPDGTVVKVPTPPVPDNRMVATIIRKMAQVAGAEYVIQVCEAWMSQNECSTLPPSQQPDRVEALLVSLDGPDLKLLTTVEIRPDGTLGVPNKAESFTGRMTGLSGAAPTSPDAFN
jgi:hypothetical protein